MLTTIISDCVTLVLKLFQWIFPALSIKSTSLNVAFKALVIQALPPCLGHISRGSSPVMSALLEWCLHAQTHTHTLPHPLFFSPCPSFLGCIYTCFY